MKNLAASVLLLLSVAAYSQTSVGWIQNTGGLAIAVDNSQNVYTVNYESVPGGDIHLTKRDSNGQFLWDSFFDNTNATRFESSTWVETDHLGNVIVTGTVNSGFSNPVKANSIIMKFDPQGSLIWRQVYESDFDGSYTKKCVIDSDNNIYVLGMGSGSNGFVCKVKKYSPDGNAVWSYFDNAGIGAATNIKLTPDNQLLLVGRSIYGSVNGYSKIDLNGNAIWSLPGIFSNSVGDAAGDAAGNTYIVHGEYVYNGGTVIKKLSSNGTQVWSLVYSMGGTRIEVGNDNMPVISGFPTSSGGGTAFMKLDANGNMLWANLNADGNLNLLMHAQMKMDAYNNAYLAAGTLFEMAICKVNSDGTSAYTITTAGSYANAFSIGTDYNVYVVGGTTVRLNQTPPEGKTLNLTLLLEGLYNGNGVMAKANNTSGPQYSGTTADMINVELHDPSNYNTIAYGFSNIPLNTNGAAVCNIPSTVTGSYYVTIKHRNSIETVSSSPVAFSGNVITYNFDNSTKAFGGNLHLSNDNHWLVYSGDINNDGIVDSSDMIDLDNQTNSFATGYLPADLNGDGLIDSTDMLLLDNNSSSMTGSVLP
ncbi:MAG: hypothetical protein IPH88_17610 [Bacteroidales bacterium]|nr:hypothetical protein [Bacteroidales bacterium]